MNQISDFINSGSDQQNIDDYLALYGSVTIHEFSHVTGANHPDEDFDSKGHQAYSCGTIGTGSTIKKRTVMASGNTHLFFSDPAIQVEGEACGVAGFAGFADNSDAVRKFYLLLMIIPLRAQCLSSHSRA